ncbi:MAG: alpha/beta fold hydrolase [Deltaproteobacteria bacterium]|nr:alpha/beta fold hydrolase [Deltaproteobacteria bacterium]
MSSPTRESNQLHPWRVMLLLGAALLAGASGLAAQQTGLARLEQDPGLNNLVHPEGYETAEPGTLGGVIRRGDGPVDMVLIAGAGFGAEVFEGFMQANAERYRMLAVTLPGFGGTPAPPMPPEKTSYGELSWTRGAQAAVVRLIEEEKLDRPVVVGHWLSATPIALGLAVERPDLVRGVIVISGVPKFVPMSGSGMAEPATVRQRVAMVDQYLAPQWFKTVTRVTWNDNNYMPRDYAIHPLRAQQLWMEAASHTLPVWIRYLCESWAQDSTAQLASLQVPVLIVEPEFDDLYHQGPQMGDYMQALLHRGWEGLEERSERIQLETISDSRVFIMDDQPERLDAAVERFVLGPAAQARQVVALRPTVVPAGGAPTIESPDIWGGSFHREGDRYVLRDAGVTIERPDASWELEPVVDGNPLLARMWDPDKTTEVTLQVRPTMGMALEALMPMVESNFAQQLPDFESVSTEKATLAGRDGFRMEFRHRKEGEMVQTALVIITLDEFQMFSVSFQTSPDDFDAFRRAFDTIGRSVTLEERGN